MKNLATTTLMVLLTFLAATGFAQHSSAEKSSPIKPFLFNKFPDVINCTAVQLNSFFAGGQGQAVNIAFDNTLTLAGNIKSNITKYSNLQTVLVQLPAFNNILFSLSKRTDEHHNIIYTGHLFNNAYADGYELKKGGHGDYQLIKISMEKMLPTCNQ